MNIKSVRSFCYVSPPALSRWLAERLHGIFLHLKTLLADPRALALKILYAFLMGFTAFLFGLLAVSGNPMLIGLGVGLVGGIMLLMAPALSVLLLIVVGLLMGALISFAGAGFGKLTWVMSAIGMLLLLPVFLSFFNLQRKSMPGYIWLAIGFLLYAVLATVLHFNSLAESIAGFKRYFQAYGLMLALGFLAFSEKNILRWQKLLLAIGLLQLPFCMYELFVLVPRRGGLDTGSATTDVVAGTFGANLEGGSPGIAMVCFVLIIFAFLFARWRNGLIAGSTTLLLSVLLLLPLGMGENKVAMLMLPMVWFVLVRQDVIRSPAKYFPVLLGGVFMTIALGYAYLEWIMHSTLSDALANTISYNFADAGYASFYLNRTTVLTFWFSQQGAKDPVGFFFGNGLGSAFLGQISGHIGMHYPRYGIDLTAASTLLWDLGIVGLLMYVGIFVGAWRTAQKIYRESMDAEVKADCLAIQAAISLFLTLTIYSQDVVNLITQEIVYALVLGYLAHLYARHVDSLKACAT